MLSDSKKYQDLRSEKHTYKLAIGSKRIENPYIQFRQIFRCAQQLVQISRYISFVATYPGGTGLSRLKKNFVLTFYFLSRSIKATRLMFWRICYPTAKNIRICDPKNIPIN